MQVNYTRHSIEIIPETDMDEVYLEQVTGLKEEGETCLAKRVAPHGISHAWAYLEIRRARD